MRSPPRHSTIALALACAALASPSAARAAARLDALVAMPETRDGLSPDQRAAIAVALAAYHRRHPGALAEKDAVAPRYLFFPQAGILGRDLFLNNFADLDPATDLVRDWDCSDYTYDGHQGHDSLIRSFREQAIGVPVFAAAAGTVVDTHDGEPDMNTVWDASTRANYVVLDHGGGYSTLYLHLKTGSVAVRPGQQVTAGTQLGLTGSSGFSDWPHLHFETRRNGQWIEPSAGPCRDGESLWSAQPAVERDLEVVGIYLSRGGLDFPDYPSLLRDEGSRAGSFVRGAQTIGLRLDLRNLPAEAPFEARVIDPHGRTVAETSGAFDNRGLLHLAVPLFSFDLDLATVGRWRLHGEIAGTAAIDVPFTVVATARQLVNHKPNRIVARLTPSRPQAGRVLTCSVASSPLAADPDSDVVAYRYEWRVKNRVVRAVTSAALSDLLAADVARPQDKVTCRVTPTDGRSAGPTATARPGKRR